MTGAAKSTPPDKPFVCGNAKYMMGQRLEMARVCPDCPHEAGDIVHGTSGASWWIWYCSFRPEGRK